MKTKTIIQVFLSLSVSSILSVQAFAHNTTNAEAAELSLHRVERLVILKKIPETFLTNVVEVSFTKLTQTQPSDPFFESVVSQVPGVDQTQKKVHILMDHDGRPLSFKEHAGSDSASPPTWPIKDSISLLEESLHCLEGELIGTNDLCQKTPELVDFKDNFSSAKLAQVILADGTITAEITVSKSTGASQVKIHFNTDGSLIAINLIEAIP